MKNRLKTLALASCAMVALATAAHAQDKAKFDIAGGDLKTALQTFATQTSQEVLFSTDIVAGRHTKGVTAETDPQTALVALLDGTGLTYTKTPTGTLLVVRADAPQSGSAAGDGAEVQALIVTAQKKEENIQDVPIAISAFTEKALQEQKIEGGYDLLKAIPNVTFSKNNFTSYNFSIRGIGTKAVSATTDPGVAVSFNNIALLQNRLFEQEYFDIERVEVLRGPQGTLYGRNATAGVINIISAKPNLQEFSGWLKGEVGNYHTKRVSAMVNVPIIEDTLGLRIAGALTDRQGFDYNEITKHAVNGRDLWSGRVTLAWNPTDKIRSNLVWERFNEDDDRSRTGKQLCHRDPGRTTVGSTSTTFTQDLNPVRRTMLSNVRASLFSQGCLPGSLYDEEAFGTPNGLALPFVMADQALHEGGTSILKPVDPYGGLMQSRDIRTIASIRDPKYRAKADILELNVDYDLSDALTLTSQTAYDRDQVYSFQDFNRFNSQPMFQDSSAWAPNLSPGGIFCDPQLGCSDRLAGFDIAQAKSEQFTQEVRVLSDFDGSLNFSAGATYTRFKVNVDYYIMYNALTAFALSFPFNGGVGNPEMDPTKCGSGGFLVQDATLDINDPMAVCPYVDPNPVESINGEGHNYFRSKNPYTLNSSAVFGELYLKPSDKWKVTLGLRYNDDRKTFIPVPSQLLLAKGRAAGGTVNRGYPESDPIKQHWGELTGRAVVEWRPDLSFTDDTMLYASYSRGYKGGGANPPKPGFATLQQEIEQAQAMNIDPAQLADLLNNNELPVLDPPPGEYQPVFRPEFVNAYELGAKNTLLQGALTANANVFFYDYKDYQVSQIRDRTAVNENFDARIWGAELQAVFAPTRNLHFLGNLGYLDTRIADGMKSIDTMDRTQGHTDWVVAKPWVQYPSNCIVPVRVAEQWVKTNIVLGNFFDMCAPIGGGILGNNQSHLIDPATGEPYYARDHPEANYGAGFYADLGGNELPNAPHWTVNLGAEYRHDFGERWRATARVDAYWQSQSWARVYNAVNDKLRGWYNFNLSFWIERDDGLKIEAYAKNLFDKTPITDTFINSDDTALTTNIFVLDPRLLGVSIKKDF